MRKQAGEICGVTMVVDDEMPHRVWWLTWHGEDKYDKEEAEGDAVE